MSPRSAPTRVRDRVAVGMLALLASACAGADNNAAAPTTIPSTTTTSTATTSSTTASPPSTSSTTTTAVPAPRVDAAALCALTPVPAEPVVVASAELTELSGLVASRQHPGLLWAHNDSGDTARLHLMHADTGADAGSWMLRGAGAFDWEDMAISTDEAGTHHLWAADFGDNFRIRSDIRIYRATEPADIEVAEALEVEEFIFTYPDGPTDAESLFVDPHTGDIIVISKSWDDSPTSIYRAPASTPPEEPTDLERLGDIDLTDVHPLVTAADITADGRVIGLRTIDEVLLWDRAPGTDIGAAMAQTPCLAPTIPEPQGEALAFLPDGSGYLTISEGENPPIHRFAVGPD